MCITHYLLNDIITDEKNVAVLITVVGSEMYALLSDLIAPAKSATKSYSDLVDVLKSHLKPVIIAEQFHLHRRQQKHIIVMH